MDDHAPFDVFLSCSSRRHARSARNLYRFLTDRRRYPFGVVEFSGIERTQPRDHSLLRNMICEEGVDESPFHRCIFIYDANPEFPQWTIEELEPCH